MTFQALLKNQINPTGIRLKRVKSSAADKKAAGPVTDRQWFDHRQFFYELRWEKPSLKGQKCVGVHQSLFWPGGTVCHGNSQISQPSLETSQINGKLVGKKQGENWGAESRDGNWLELVMNHVVMVRGSRQSYGFQMKAQFGTKIARILSSLSANVNMPLKYWWKLAKVWMCTQTTLRHKPEPPAEGCFFKVKEKGFVFVFFLLYTHQDDSENSLPRLSSVW